MTQYLKESGKEKAAALVLDPSSGEVLAMVSFPSFNNNEFSGGISNANYSALISNPNQPLFNRVISGNYPSGSTVKPIIAAAALNEELITPRTRINSTGGIQINQWFFPDWRAGGHGSTDLRRSLAWSVNTYYYYIGGGYENFKGLGVERISEYMKEFQLGAPLGIDLPAESGGFIPTREWKEAFTGEKWYIGDTYHLAIGQGDLLVTPLQVATWTSFFANNGTIYRPTLVHSISDTQENTQERIEIHPFILNKNFIMDQHVQAVRQGLIDAVTLGSAQRMLSLPVTSAGKTGTAQWHSTRDEHSWFTAFAPTDTPQIVVTTLVEEGGEGGDLALSITRDLMESYFSQ